MTSFLRLVEDLLREPTERAAYLADPAGYLPARGFADFDTEDVELSLSLTADALPPALAARLDPSAGLDTVVSVDIDELPGLWGTGEADALTLDDLAQGDDPFFEDDGGDPVDDPIELDAASDPPLDGPEDMPAVDPVDSGDPGFDDAFADGFGTFPDPAEEDTGFEDADEPFSGPELDDVLDLEIPPSLDDDIPFD